MHPPTIMARRPHRKRRSPRRFLGAAAALLLGSHVRLVAADPSSSPRVAAMVYDAAGLLSPVDGDGRRQRLSTHRQGRRELPWPRGGADSDGAFGPPSAGDDGPEGSRLLGKRKGTARKGPKPGKKKSSMSREKKARGKDGGRDKRTKKNEKDEKGKKKDKSWSGDGHKEQKKNKNKDKGDKRKEEKKEKKKQKKSTSGDAWSGGSDSGDDGDDDAGPDWDDWSGDGSDDETGSWSGDSWSDDLWSDDFWSEDPWSDDDPWSGDSHHDPSDSDDSWGKPPSSTSSDSGDSSSRSRGRPGSGYRVSNVNNNNIVFYSEDNRRGGSSSGGSSGDSGSSDSDDREPTPNPTPNPTPSPTSKPTQSPTPAPTKCTEVLNMCFALDMSSSVCWPEDQPVVGQGCRGGCPDVCYDDGFSRDICCDNFATIQAFSLGLVAELIRIPADQSFSVVEFEDDARIVSRLSPSGETLSRIDGLSYKGGSTNTARAFDLCQDTLSSAAGTRFIVLVTDGVPTVPEGSPVQDAIAAADDAKGDGTRIVPVFIDRGNNAEARAFMRRVSSDGNVFFVEEFDELGDVVEDLIGSITDCA